MEIFDTLRLDHAAIRAQVDLLIQASSTDENNLSGTATSETASQGAFSLADDWAQIFYDLKRALKAHDRAEENVLYEVLARIPNREDLADIKTEEHHLAEETLQDLEELSPADHEWSATLALFRNQLESHVAEEETFIFSLLSEVLSDEEGLRMADEFNRQREVYLDEDEEFYTPQTTQTNADLYCEYPRRY